MSKSSLWERTVQWTIAVGERILAPIERFIGKRSLVDDATFFPLERFPWVAHIEENCAASTIVLSDEQFDMLGGAGA